MKHLSKSLFQCKQRIASKTRKLVQFWQPLVPTYVSLGCFILVFLSRDMWSCHNLLSKMCKDLYLTAKAFKKKSLQLSSSLFFVHLSWEKIVCETFIIHFCCVGMDTYDGYLSKALLQQQKKIKKNALMAFKVEDSSTLSLLSTSCLPSSSTRVATVFFNDKTKANKDTSCEQWN